MSTPAPDPLPTAPIVLNDRHRGPQPALCALCGCYCTPKHHVTRAGTVHDAADAHHDPKPEGQDARALRAA